MSKPKYALCNLDSCVAIVWETEVGLVTVVQDKIDINGDITLMDISNGKPFGEKIKNVDLRDLLVSILPTDRSNKDETKTV